jgi:hypothetical protein
MPQAPYGQTLPLRKPLTAESWNHTHGETATVPAGARITVLHVNDANHTTVDATPDSKDGWATLQGEGRAYRLVVPNDVLADALGVEPWGEQFDLVGFIMDVEGENISEADFLKGMQLMVDDGSVWSLQGSWGRSAKNLIRQGKIKDTHGVYRRHVLSL